MHADKGFCIIDMDLNILHASNSFMKLFEQLDGREMPFNLSAVVDDPDMLQRWKTVMKRALKSRELQETELCLRHKEKSICLKAVFIPTTLRNLDKAAVTVYLGSWCLENESDDIFDTLSRELIHTKCIVDKKNIALQELLSQFEEHKRKLKDEIQSTVNAEVLPMIISLKGQVDNSAIKKLEFLEKCIRDITSPFVNKLESAHEKLSTRELQICDMIKKDFSSKDIAHALNISVNTVNNMRQRIRRKLGLDKQKINLTSYLKSI